MSVSWFISDVLRCVLPSESVEDYHLPIIKIIKEHTILAMFGQIKGSWGSHGFQPNHQHLGCVVLHCFQHILVLLISVSDFAPPRRASHGFVTHFAEPQAVVVRLGATCVTSPSWFWTCLG